MITVTSNSAVITVVFLNYMCFINTKQFLPRIFVYCYAFKP